MNRHLVTLSVALLTGAVAGYGLGRPATDIADSHPAAATGFEPGAAQAASGRERHTDCLQLSELERALRSERSANESLRSEVRALESSVAELTAQQDAMSFPSSGQLPEGDWLTDAWSELAVDNEPADRRRMLIDAGFAPGRADWLLARESELRMTAIEARYSEAVAGEPLDMLESSLAARQSLRKEIGDFEYERYLEATGQSTAVSVTQVIEGSPAQFADLQVGDEIVDYGGKRIFNMFELMEQAQAGNPGEIVIVSIMRNGMPMNLYLKRGPLGISGGKPRYRR